MKNEIIYIVFETMFFPENELFETLPMAFEKYEDAQSYFESKKAEDVEIMLNCGKIEDFDIFDYQFNGEMAKYTCKHKEDDYYGICLFLMKCVVN